MDAAILAQNLPDFRGEQFELFDTCVLIKEPTLVGIISRTYHDGDPDDMVDDCLIISHVPVPPAALQSFLQSGVPPKGYVFIRFAREEFGHSLVAEQDVRLVARTFAIGDNVKRRAGDAMIGTVTSVSESYVLQPICSAPRTTPYGEDQPFQFHTGFRNCDETCVPRLPAYLHHNLRHALLYDVPGGELKRANDFKPGDYVVEQEHLGYIHDQDVDAVLLLDNNTVVIVESAWNLQLVVPDFDSPLVALPELDDLPRPDVVAYDVGGRAFIPTDNLNRGQFVTTNHRNLKNGRWLFGEYDPNCSPRGHVLDVRTRRAHVAWLCPNASLPSVPYKQKVTCFRPYDNLSSYNNPRDLRRTKGLILLDQGQSPGPPKEGSSLRVNIGQCLEAGDQVRFRDPSAAFVKYQGHGHGQYNRTSRNDTFGFDMNEFIVFYSQQTVRIRWQNGDETEDAAVSMRPYALPEQELCVGNIVAMKEGSTQVAIGKPEDTATPFNEMIYLQGDYILRPKKVGVLQSINAQERLGRIRWFVEPHVKLLQQGRLLQRGAYFGPLSDDVEDVSLFEVMAHPGLMRNRRQLVIFLPLNLPIDLLRSIADSPNGQVDERLGLGHLSWSRAPAGMDMYTFLRTLAQPLAERDLETFDATMPIPENILDWVGVIVDLGLDGMLTIRLTAYPHCTDVCVPWERVLVVLSDEDEDSLGASTGGANSSSDDEMEDPLYSSDESIISAIEETIEYEGGERIDSESGDDAWSTDGSAAPPSPKQVRSEENLTREGMDYEESLGPKHVQSEETSTREVDPTAPSGAKHVQSEEASTMEVDPAAPSGPKRVQNEEIISQLSQPSTRISNLRLLASNLGNAPPAFLVLDSPPPDDGFLGSHASSPVPSRPTTFLKRITREHRLLQDSLPTTPYSPIYLRTYASRLDLLRSLIVGPADTPYEFAPFLIDLYLPPKYPNVPPVAHFHSWTSGLGRINPNLYEEGKICLSLLGTWPGRGGPELGDTWTAEKGSILQVLLSLMGLVLAKRPFYNEAGFEGFDEPGGEGNAGRGASGLYQVESLLYSEKAFVLARGFARVALTEWVGLGGFEEVLAWLYLPRYETRATEGSVSGKGEEVLATQSSALDTRPELLRKLIHRARALMNYSTTCTGDQRDDLVDGSGQRNAEAFLLRLSQGAVVMLRRHLGALEQCFEIRSD